MKIFDKALVSQGRWTDGILVHSFEEYKELGGKRDMLDIYAKFKEQAKHYENLYISRMDMSLSGIEVSDDEITELRNRAQIFWTLIALWFNKPLRVVNYSTFDINEFDQL